MKSKINNYHLIALTIIVFIATIFLLKDDSKKHENKIGDHDQKKTELEKLSSNKVELMYKQIPITEIYGEKAGDYMNFDLLIDKNKFTKTEILELSKLIDKKYCNSRKYSCNSISLWNNREAYHLSKHPKIIAEDPEWLRKHWVFICDSHIFWMTGSYKPNGRENEAVLYMYPYVGEDYYKKYGGKMQKFK